MSWFLEAEHLMRILEDWNNLGGEAQYLYMKMLQQMVENHIDYSCNKYERMVENFKHFPERKHKLDPKNYPSYDEIKESCIKYTINDIVKYGIQSTKHFKDLPAGWYNTAEPEVLALYDEESRRFKYYLEQIYCGGNPYRRPPKRLG